jgi:hypothetical protein
MSRESWTGPKARRKASKVAEPAKHSLFCFGLGYTARALVLGLTVSYRFGRPPLEGR